MPPLYPGASSSASSRHLISECLLTVLSMPEGCELNGPGMGAAAQEESAPSRVASATRIRVYDCTWVPCSVGRFRGSMKQPSRPGPVDTTYQNQWYQGPGPGPVLVGPGPVPVPVTMGFVVWSVKVGRDILHN